MKAFTLPILVGLFGLATARTDLSGCVSSATTNQWHEASMIWYVPDSGEICDFVDCGGGRAPPKTDQPGCPLYTGTAALTPSYLPGYGPNGKMVASTTTVSETSTTIRMHTTIISSAEPSSESSSHSSSESSSESSSSTITHSGNTMITAAPTSSPVVSLTKTVSPSSKARSSTSAAPTSTEIGNVAAIPVSNMAGVMAIAAAVIGAFAL